MALRNKIKILYFMHISWGWIKQRPHFIAEGLFKYYTLKVFIKKEFKKSVVVNKSNIVINSIFRLPLERFPFIFWLSSLICKLQLIKHVKNTDVIWVMSPLQFDSIPLFLNKFLIYDCMDDMVEFELSDKKRKRIEKKERCLYNAASLVIVSSDYLKNKLIQRYGTRQIYVVNNALREIPSMKENIDIPEALNKYFLKGDARIRLVYIGTIAHWFDFSLIASILDKFDNIDVYLFGPTELNIPDYERLHYCKSVEHDLVFPIMNRADMLIMPFIVNELIRSVNPVKLYEYIASGKPCLAPLYHESLKFEKYVYLYDSNNKCLEMISYLLENKMKSKRTYEECYEFAKENTWDSRIDEIVKLIDNYVITSK